MRNKNQNPVGAIPRIARDAGITEGVKYPKVSCSRCGNCCRVPMVPVTHKDLARLVKATGRAAGEIVRFCPDSEMEFDESSGLWISFGGIRRAMVLRRRAGGCMFQTKEYACSAYASRPQTCRTFPYSVYFEDEKNSAVSEIKLNKVLDCSAKRCLSVDIDTIIADVRKENREDKEYHRLVKRWNEAKKKGTGADFLKFIGF